MLNPVSPTRGGFVMSLPFFDAMRELGERVAQAPHVLLCLDYDGTLTPFAITPPRANLSPQMDRALLALADHSALSVAVVSGRNRGDMQAMVGVPGFIYAGNHGLEISGPGYVFIEPNAAAKVETLDHLAAELSAKLHEVEGALVEFKGLTISVHFRQVKHEDLDEVRRRVHSALAAASHPFVLNTGEKVFEIRPRVDWTKANAVSWIRDRLGQPDLLTIYVGDDVSDEDAFKFLQDGITVKVGTSGETAARYHLGSPGEVRKFVEWLDELLRHKEQHRQAMPATVAVGGA
jgi:trehalose 6-phosphate phosphatase